LEFVYGSPNIGFVPIVGDFNRDGLDTIALYEAPTGIFYLRNSNTQGFADLTFAYELPNMYPLIGNWDGQ
jgi:hypothetical protein